MGVNELLLIVGVILVSGGLVSAFRSSTSGAAFTFMGVSALDRSRYAAIDSQTLLFWAIAVLIVLFIGYSSRKSDVVPNLWKNYIVGGALAGMVVGLIYGQAGMIVGSAAGAVLGAVACWRISRSAVNHRALRRAVVTVGLPAVVTMTLVGLGVLGILQNNLH